MNDKPTISDASPESLGRLMQFARPSQRLWRPDDLGAVLKHQMQIPLESALGARALGRAPRPGAGGASEGCTPQSLDDLIHHPNPPVRLLALAKDHAKSCLRHPDRPLPPDVSRVLYYASIASGLARVRRRISKLTDAELREGFNWGQAQPWIDERLRTLFSDALAALPTI